ncbi:MAG: peptidoglycan-binding protein [Oscillospiraceae bacterium]|nr:peptidoglycan-binding protein [Oscillospiraceae bacterium]
MAITLPYVPETITVHLGAPNADAPNVTVNYVDYLKNVVAGEIYPTWDVSAIRANVLAINSYALNRVYTEYYRSRGYDFDITSTTAYDQSYSYGRSTFENTDDIVEELFDTYIRRQGFTEPLAAKFCNGTTVTCEGLSQWGSQELAQQGLNSVEILKTYYGDNIELVSGAPIRGIEPSYPGTPLRVGSSGTEVLVMQLVLNRIRQNYPSIPQIEPDGVFGPQTEQAVRTFQRVFGLTADGIVGRATWYQIVRIYVAVKQLAELQSEGLQYYLLSWAPQTLHEGDEGVQVAHLQYMLDVVSHFAPEVPHVAVRGKYDESTAKAVSAFQHFAGLPESGEADEATWNCLCGCVEGIENAVLHVRMIQYLLCALGTEDVIPDGRYGEATRRAVARFQLLHGLPPTGQCDDATWRALVRACNSASETV